MTLSIWLCPHCGADLKPQNLRGGLFLCAECGWAHAVGDASAEWHPYVPPPIPDPESDDE